MTPALVPDCTPEFAKISFDETFGSWPRRWVIGALGALALHLAGGALVFGYLRDTTVDLGAPGLVVDVELTAPRRDPNDLPVGLDTEASAQAPSVVEQKTVVQKNDLPKDTPTDTDDPDRFVSSEDVKQPVDQDPKITSVQAAPSNPSIAAQETAIPSVATARESTVSVTPSPGTGASTIRERVTWQKELAAHFDKYKRYPEDRAERSAQVIVNFVLDSVGHIVSSRIVKSSGDPVFDAAALSMLQRSDPVPPPPPLVASAGLSFTMPVIFHVKAPR